MADYRKIDSALALALEDVVDEDAAGLEVFVHTVEAPGPRESDSLTRLGVQDVSGGRVVFSSTLSPAAIKELSRQPWVRYLRLSRKLRLVSDQGIHPS
jgi:hypothetical protein